jgi:hypothetical protein
MDDTGTRAEVRWCRFVTVGEIADRGRFSVCGDGYTRGDTAMNTPTAVVMAAAIDTV